MNTTIISPRMLEAGESAVTQFCIAHDVGLEIARRPWDPSRPLPELSELIAAIYEAMHAKHVEALFPTNTQEGE